MRCKSIVKSDVFGAVCIVVIPDIQVGELLCIKYGQPQQQNKMDILCKVLFAKMQNGLMGQYEINYISVN